jgi:hypothetical protein
LRNTAIIKSRCGLARMVFVSFSNRENQSWEKADSLLKTFIDDHLLSSTLWKEILWSGTMPRDICLLFCMLMVIAYRL